jgi:hypothetical protein
MILYHDMIMTHVKQESLLANTSCLHIYLEILQNIKYDITMILDIVKVISYSSLIYMILVYNLLQS